MIVASFGDGVISNVRCSPSAEAIGILPDVCRQPDYWCHSRCLSSVDVIGVIPGVRCELESLVS